MLILILILCLASDVNSDPTYHGQHQTSNLVESLTTHLGKGIQMDVDLVRATLTSFFESRHRLKQCHGAVRLKLSHVCNQHVHRTGAVDPKRRKRTLEEKGQDFVNDSYLDLSDLSTLKKQEHQHNTTKRRWPFLSVRQANLFVTTWVEGNGGHRRNRRGGHSITAECCTKTSCTWEEYAEYCPVQHRQRSAV